MKTTEQLKTASYMGKRLGNKIKGIITKEEAQERLYSGHNTYRLFPVLRMKYSSM